MIESSILDGIQARVVWKSEYYKDADNIEYLIGIKIISDNEESETIDKMVSEKEYNQTFIGIFYDVNLTKRK